MTRLVIIVFALLIAQQALAQNPVSIDSFRLHKPRFEKVDSLKLSLSTKMDSVKRIQNLPQQKLDSLRKKQNALSLRIDSVKQKFTYRIDSLKSLDMPDTFLIKKYTALQTELDSIKQKLPLNGLSVKMQSKIDSAEIKLNSSLEKLNNRVSNITKGKVKIPEAGGVNLDNSMPIPAVNLPNLGLPSINNPLSDIKLPELNTPGVDLKTPESRVPNANVSVPDVKGLDKISAIQEKAGKLGEISGEVAGYKDEITNLKEKGLDELKLSEELENRVSELDQIKTLQKEAGGVNPLTNNWNDPDVAKEMAFNKGKEVAMNHFAGHEQELVAAMEQFAKIRAQIKNPEETIDMLKKGSNSMKDKKFIERLIPSFSLQLQKPNAFWFDLNPSIGYKLLSKFAVHAGFNYRLAYHVDEHWMKEERIYGPRMILEFAWREFFSFIGQAEVMNSPIKPNGNPSVLEYTNRAWVWSYMIGTKASYKISNNVRGNAQVLYNLYDPSGQSPYADRLNIRMGVEFRLKKKQTKIKVSD